MAGGGSSKSNPPKARKRVEVDTDTSNGSSLVRAKDGSAFARCDECNKTVPVALISMHSCSLDAKIKMNLESQVVERSTESKKPTPRNNAKFAEPKAKKLRTGKKTKNGKISNAPKRPPTAFFLFLDDFRKTFKEENPDAKGVKEVAKQGGERWRSMTDEEKKHYQDKATELKAEYEKALESSTAGEGECEGDSEEVLEKEVEEVSDGE